MRTIKFRGKSAATGEWVYGNVVSMPDGISGYAIVGDHFKLPSCDAIGTEEYREVLNDTIGQYIGVTDYNNEPLFEGDIVKYGGECYEIAYLEKYARFAGTKPGVVFAVFDLGYSVLAGNIFDNPDIMKEV